MLARGCNQNRDCLGDGLHIAVKFSWFVYLLTRVGSL